MRQADEEKRKWEEKDQKVEVVEGGGIGGHERESAGGRRNRLGRRLTMLGQAGQRREVVDNPVASRASPTPRLHHLPEPRTTHPRKRLFQRPSITAVNFFWLPSLINVSPILVYIYFYRF